ncbi:UVR8 [Symbiodinium sp. CCMP2592]|nr:UVR8 [Symbiodinium sp. CCMP2592]
MYQPNASVVAGCIDASQSCQCGQNAQMCMWTDSKGQERAECRPSAVECPMTCSGKLCNLADYRLNGAVKGSRELCLVHDGECPCGENAIQCKAGQETYCLPRWNAESQRLSECPLECGEEEQRCCVPSFGATGEFLRTEEICVAQVPKGQPCGCGAGAFDCNYTDGTSGSECLPLVGGFCPSSSCAAGACPAVVDYLPNGDAYGLSPPPRACATGEGCHCGREAKWCDALGCIFKDQPCPPSCTSSQKLCTLADYTSSGTIAGYRDVCIDRDQRCPCGQNTRQCPGSDLCVLRSLVNQVCPCAAWQKACEVSDYSLEGVPESANILCTSPDAMCPCGQNSLRCQDPKDANRTVCTPKFSGLVANQCPSPCSLEEELRGNRTCVQIHLLPTFSFRTISCRAPAECLPGERTKLCPSGAFVPVWQSCQGPGGTQQTARRLQTAAVVVEKESWVIVTFRTLHTSAANSLAEASLLLQFAVQIPSWMETSITLIDKVLTFKISGEGSLNADQGTADPSDFALRLRVAVLQNGTDAQAALRGVGDVDAQAGVSIVTQQTALALPEDVSTTRAAEGGADESLILALGIIIGMAGAMAGCVICACCARRRHGLSLSSVMPFEADPSNNASIEDKEFFFITPVKDRVRKTSSVDSYSLSDPASLIKYFLDADVRPVRLAYLVELQKAKKPWPRRQDPWGYQLAEAVSRFREKEGDRSKVWLFIDYVSLYQYKRDAVQQINFKRALEAMHILYAHEVERMRPKISVYKESHQGVVEVPISELNANNVPYSERGWCQAEKEQNLFASLLQGRLSGFIRGCRGFRNTTRRVFAALCEAFGGRRFRGTAISFCRVV